MPYDFDPNDRAAITAALASDDPRHPIAVAVASRLVALSQALKRATEQGGGPPDRIDMPKPTTVLDEIVVDLFRRSLESVPFAPPLVVSETLKQ